MQQLLFDGWTSDILEEPSPDNDFNVLLQTVIDEAKAVGIPVSDKISPQIITNSRAKTRFGSCKKLGDMFIIELSSLLLRAPEFSCRQILAHEILHTCNGCRNHGARWRSYARRIGNACGYNIARVDSHENLGIENKPTPKFIVVCSSCGNSYERVRASKLTQHPDRYRCRCGGKLKLQK